MQGLYLNTPPKPEQAYSKRKPRGHTVKSLEAAKKEDLEQVAKKIWSGSQQKQVAMSRSARGLLRWRWTRGAHGQQRKIQQVEAAWRQQAHR